MSRPLPEPTAAVLAAIDAALRARERLRRRPLAVTMDALAAAAPRWRRDAALAAALPDVIRLAPATVDAGVAFASEALDAKAIAALVSRAYGAGAAQAPPPDGPALVAHVLASNVPALALPAIALACLAGAAVLVKSGRDDPLSAPAFAAALRDLDPELAATIVTAYWPGGDVEREEAVFGRADVVVLTGGSPALQALASRVRRRMIAHGPRVSAALVGRDALGDPALPDALALDVALHDQRGCLSPHAVYVEGTSDDAVGLAERLGAALDRMARRLPPGPASLADRAARRQLVAEAEWDGATVVCVGDAGTVLYDPRPAFRPGCGGRAVRVHPLSKPADLPALLANDTVECVALAGVDPRALVPALRARGVSRLCAPGSMQRPPLGWPRAQLAPLASLAGRPTDRVLEVEM